MGAYDRYEPFAKDPHAALKGTRVGLAARHLIDTLSRLLEDEVEAWIEDQFTVSKALFYHYYVANPWHTPRAGDRYWRDDDELNKRPKNGSEYWCCPITPLQHYVPGCLKRNRWVRNYDYQRTKRERRAHANIQYDLTSGFDAELLSRRNSYRKGIPPTSGTGIYSGTKVERRSGVKLCCSIILNKPGKRMR